MRVRAGPQHRQRVDLQVIAIPPPNFHYHVLAEVGVDFARIQNDALADLSDREPDHFHWFATLPLQDIAPSLEEIARIGGQPRMRGVQAGTNIDGVDFDHPILEPVWAALEKADLSVWLHPDQRSIAGAGRLDQFYLLNMVGLPMESTIAAARLIFGGRSRAPSQSQVRVPARWRVSSYQVGRWDHGWRVRQRAARRR